MEAIAAKEKIRLEAEARAHERRLAALGEEVTVRTAEKHRI